MRDMDLNSAFKPTPQVFHQRVEQTLCQLKEEPVKRFTLRTAALTAALVLLLAGIAYAAVQLGQEWYYDTRYTNFKEHKPELHQAIMENLQTDIPQQVSGEAAQLVQVTVQDVAWADEKDVMTLSILAEPKTPNDMELHSAWSMDVDGALVGEIDPDDEESRLFHWLWTEKGFGLPEEVMLNPEKQLLLLELDYRTFIGGTEAEMPSHGGDSFTTEAGPVMMVQQYDLSQLVPEGIDAMFADATAPEGYDEAEYLKTIEETKQTLKDQGKAAAAAILESTDEDGYLTLRQPFQVMTFANNTYGEPVQGEITFKVKVTGE